MATNYTDAPNTQTLTEGALQPTTTEQGHINTVSGIQANVVTFGDLFQTGLIIEAKIHSAIKEVVHRNPYQVSINL